MDALIIGGAGYIGSHCCKVLKNRGYNPVVFDNFSTGFRKLVQWGDFVEADISDRDRLVSVFENYSIGTVMHFAARALVGESVLNPYAYYKNNVSSTLDLLDIMRKFEVNNIIFSSSAAIFGNPVNIPIDENHPTNPINPYGRSKLMVEQILNDFEHAYGLKYVTLRYFNAAGADVDGETGELHDPETHLIPLAFQAALGQRGKLEIYGTDYETPDGTCVRDYIHVNDLAQAHVLAMEWLLDGNGSQQFNLGNERGFSVREIVDVAGKVSGRKVPVMESPRRPGDPPELVAANKKAKDTLGWTPRFDDIEQILSTAWNWHRKLAGAK